MISLESVWRVSAVLICASTVSSSGFADTYNLQPVYIDTIGHYAPLDYYPVAVTADSQLVYSVDLFYEEVRAYTHSGELVWSFPYLNTWPRDIEVDQEGNIYVPDANQQNIRKYSPSGELLLTIGSTGTQPGQFGRPMSIALDGAGNIYAADQDTEVSKFGPDGRLIWNNIGLNNPNADLSRPNGIALDSQGNIYVADSNNRDIIVFDPTGHYIRSIGPAPFNWYSPVDVAVTHDDYLLMLDRDQDLNDVGKDQIFKLTLDGTLVDAWAPKGRTPGELWEPQGLSTDPNGDLWVAGYQGHNIVQYGADGAFIQEWNDHNIQPYEFAQLNGAAVGAHGRLYVVDFWNQVVQVFDRYGNYEVMWGERGQGKGTVFNFPRFTAINPSNGEIYIDDDHQVRRIDAEGNFLSLSDRMNYPGGIDVTNSGEIWITDRFSNAIRKYTNDLHVLQVVDGTNIPSGLNEPTDIAVDHIHNRLYVTDKNKDRIVVLDLAGNYLFSWGTRGKDPGKFRAPIGIALDSQGRVYVSEMTNQRIQVFSSEGQYLYGWNVPGVPGKDVARIWELAFDGDYFLYGPDRTDQQAEVHKWALVPSPPLSGAPSYTAGQDIGYYIWSDDQSRWHLRWSADGVHREFTGTITSTVPFSSHTGIDLEGDDHINDLSDTRIDFAASESDSQDGIDIVTSGNGVITFDLSIDGLEQHQLVHVGSNNFIPTSLPLPLFSSAPSLPQQLGMPSYAPGQNLGYYVWQDEDDGEWHIRWSGDGNDNYNFTGNVSISGGTLISSRKIGFEGVDSVTSDTTSFSFNGLSDVSKSDDGVDFFVSDGATVNFELAIGGSAANGAAWIGSSNTPASGSFSLTSLSGSVATPPEPESIPTVGTPDYAPRSDLGYHIWQDTDDAEWHIRWVGNTKKTYNFDGVIYTGNPASNVRGFSMESDDVFVADADRILFSARAGSGQDGLDFFVPPGTTLTFAIEMDNEKDASLVFIGPDGISPGSQPFSLLSADIRSSVFGMPSYAPGQNLGYYVWQDEDDGEWHIRWSGDGNDNYNFTGNVSISGGTLISSRKIGFEGVDSVTSDTTSFSFNGLSDVSKSDDGVDFFVSDGATVNFELAIGGSAANGAAWIGSSNTPASGSFSLTSLSGSVATPPEPESIPTVGTPDYAPRSDLGYHIWQDTDDAEWHIRWVGNTKKTYNFDGVIYTGNPASNVRGFSMESDDVFVADADRILFSARAGSGQDGLDFFVPPGTTLTFAIEMDNEKDASLVFIGPDGISPGSQPFSLLSADIRSSVFGMPSYAPGQNLGYYVWQDEDDGEWHIRWSGDGNDNYNFTGNVSISGGTLISSRKIGFEGVDSVTSDTTSFSFNGLSDVSKSDDGVDFFVSDGATVNFELAIGGSAANGAAWIGSSNTPASGSFSLTSLSGSVATPPEPESIPTVGTPDYAPRSDLGYHIWQDTDDAEWHIRWVGNTKKTYNFDGVIYTGNPASNVRGFSMESDDVFVADADRILFSARAGSGQDGLDFFVPPGTTLTFAIEMDNEKDASLVFIGPDGISPGSQPFSLLSAE